MIMPASTTRLGPGTLTLGPTATVEDASCQLVNAVISWDKEEDDPITVLCGDVVPGSTTYTASLSGSLLQDLADEAGLVAYTWANKGTAVDFVFTPNTAAGATVTGQLVLDPLDVGSTDDYGVIMQSDFEWSCVGEPELTWVVTPLDAEEPALA
jgi:hypothetical protein